MFTHHGSTSLTRMQAIFKDTRTRAVDIRSVLELKKRGFAQGRGHAEALSGIPPCRTCEDGRVDVPFWDRGESCRKESKTPESQKGVRSRAAKVAAAMAIAWARVSLVMVSFARTGRVAEEGARF